MPCSPVIPDPPALREYLRALALLDSILTVEDHLRYYWFHPDWAEDLEMARVNNGGGDEMFVVFGQAGVVIKGFDHESPVSPYANDDAVWPGIYDGLPKTLRRWLRDPALSHDDVTFCFWREPEDPVWRQGPVEFPDDEDDGSSWLLSTIHPTPGRFLDWAADYYERVLDELVVRAVYRGRPPTEGMIRRLHPEADSDHVLRVIQSWRECTT